MIVEYLQSLDKDVLEKGIIFFWSAFAVMAYFYVEKWCKISSPRPKLLSYLIWNNPDKTYKAVQRLIILTMGGGIIGQLSVMNFEMIVSTAAGVGYLAFKEGVEK